MLKNMNPLLRWSGKLSIVGIGLCALCCLAPFIIGLSGLAGISFLFEWSEKLGIVFMALSLILLMVWQFRKKAHSCSVDCSCKSENIK
ncbi:hypothetical protein CH372_19555 [Leptospira meyeri]|nr:hypothetical protein CH372_19555 [Leptospira meyeri]PKA22312.1 hypothetical protein CH381_31520 [Leptospira sp. mixed culture ATI2-C-A1]